VLQVYNSVVSSIESEGRRVLAKHSVVVVHHHTGQAVDDDTLLCYDRDATALLVPSRYVCRHDDPRKQSWYHPVPLTSHQASLWLRSRHQPGCFLVYREAGGDGADQLALCLDDDVVVHYDIHVSSLGDCAIDGDCRHFLGVSDLVHYYQQNVGSLATRLRRPLRDATCPPTHGYHFPADIELDRRRLHFTTDIVVGGRSGGAGSSGVVWAGVYDGQSVVIKVLQRQDTSQSHQTQLDDEFLNETTTLLAVRHENIVRLVGVCSVSRPLLIVTEHGFTTTLKDHLRAAVLSSRRRDELLDIGMQVTAGVAYLASLRYVLHRAVSASSFVVIDACSDSDARCRVKLTDFSRARRVSADDCYMADGTELLLVKWAAPEVLSQLRYSSRSDVWALGIVLWQASHTYCFSRCRSLPLPLSFSPCHLHIVFITPLPLKNHRYRQYICRSSDRPSVR